MQHYSFCKLIKLVYRTNLHQELALEHIGLFLLVLPSSLRYLGFIDELVKCALSTISTVEQVGEMLSLKEIIAKTYQIRQTFLLGLWAKLLFMFALIVWWV